MKKLLAAAFFTLTLVAFNFFAGASQVMAQVSRYSAFDSNPELDGLAFSTTILFYCCICGIGLVVYLVPAYLVYRDAKKVGVDSAALWAIICLFTGGIGIILYVFTARKDAKDASSKLSTTTNSSTDSQTDNKTNSNS